MSVYVYPGHPPFIQAAAAEHRLPEAALEAGRQSSLPAMDGLIGALARLEPGERGGVFDHVRARRDALAIAHAAAEKILVDIANGYGLPVPAPIIVGTTAVQKRSRLKEPSRDHDGSKNVISLEFERSETEGVGAPPADRS